MLHFIFTSCNCTFYTWFLLSFGFFCYAFNRRHSRHWWLDTDTIIKGFHLLFFLIIHLLVRKFMILNIEYNHLFYHHTLQLGFRSQPMGSWTRWKVQSSNTLWWQPWNCGCDWCGAYGADPWRHEKWDTHCTRRTSAHHSDVWDASPCWWRAVDTAGWTSHCA